MKFQLGKWANNAKFIHIPLLIVLINWRISVTLQAKGAHKPHVSGTDWNQINNISCDVWCNQKLSIKFFTLITSKRKQTTNPTLHPF